MNKCVFILPYFGKFNNYFNLFLRSCGYNPTYDWLILSDNKDQYSFPSNVRVVYITFNDMQKKISGALGMEITLPKPYKLCDFKPTYGYVFSEYITGYDFWGHCDCDVLFGDLKKLLTPLLEKDYDKYFAAGHLTIYKNSKENNRRFMHMYNGRLLYKEFLTVPEICWFDEDWKADNIHSLFLSENARVYSKFLAFNPSGKYTFFRQRYYIPKYRKYAEENYRKALYVWDQGSIVRFYIEHDLLVKEEYLYIHLQHRSMKVKKNAWSADEIQIMPNHFVAIHHIPCSVREINKFNLEPFSAYTYFWKKQMQRVKRKIDSLL